MEILNYLKSIDQSVYNTLSLLLGILTLFGSKKIHDLVKFIYYKIIVLVKSMVIKSIFVKKNIKFNIILVQSEIEESIIDRSFYEGLVINHQFTYDEFYITIKKKEGFSLIFILINDNIINSYSYHDIKYIDNELIDDLFKINKIDDNEIKYDTICKFMHKKLSYSKHRLDNVDLLAFLFHKTKTTIKNIQKTLNINLFRD